MLHILQVGREAGNKACIDYPRASLAQSQGAQGDSMITASTSLPCLRDIVTGRALHLFPCLTCLAPSQAQLHEYLKGMQAARAAFQDRAQAVVTVQTLTGDLAAKRGKLERLNAQGPRPGDISRVKKAIEIEEEIDKATRAKAAAEAELERIKVLHCTAL